MPAPFSPIHPFQPQVERLRAELAKAGTPKTHAELLHLVAITQGVTSWDQLEHQPKQGWLARKLGWGHHWRRQSILHRDELLFDLRMNSLCLGVEPEWKSYGHERVDLDSTWARRGLLVVGPQGKGCTTALEHYEAQQIAQGGGLLVLDASPNYETGKKLQAVAEDAGRADFTHYRHDEPDGKRLRNVAELLNEGAAAYVNLPWGVHGAPAQREAEAFVHQLLEHARPGGALSSRSRPFMVVVPEGGWLLTSAWLPLLHYARPLGVMLALRLHSLDELSHLSPDVTEAVLNMGTRLFLAPNSEAALTSAAKALALGQEHKVLAATRKRLSELGLGEALMRQGQGKTKLLRLRLLLSETRDESRAARRG